MKILIVSQYFHPESFRINELARALAHKGHEITVLTAWPTYPKRDLFRNYPGRWSWFEEYHGIRIYRVPIWTRNGSGRVELSLNYLSFVASATLLGLPRLFFQHFDVQFVWATSPITACFPAIAFRALKGIPIVMWVQDLWPEVVSAVGAVKNPHVMGLLRSMVRFIYKRCDLLLAQSPGFLKAIVQKGIPESRVIVVPNWGLDSKADLSKRPTQAEQLAQVEGFKILYAGNIGKAQDWETVLSAAEQLRNTSVKWVLMGDGSERTRLHQFVQERDLQHSFVFLPPCSPEEVAFVYAEADANVITLKSDPVLSLTIPSKVQSCLATGKPIVAVVDGEAERALLETRSTFCTRPGDVHGLVESVRTLVDLSETDRKKLGESGRSWYNQYYTENAVVEKINHCLRQLE